MMEQLADMQSMTKAEHVGLLIERIYDDAMGGRSLKPALCGICTSFSAVYGSLSISFAERMSGQMVVENGERQPRSNHHLILRASEAQRFDLELQLARTSDDTPFTEAEQRLCETLLSHLRRALNLSARVSHSEAENQLFGGALDKMLVGALMLDKDGFIVSETPIAQQMLADKHGICKVQGRLKAVDSHRDRILQAVIKDGLKAALAGDIFAPSLVSLPRQGEAGTLALLVQRAASGHGHGSPVLSILIKDPEAHIALENAMLRQLYDLTPAESAVARCLTDGLTLEEAAQALAISRNTVRAHLRAIFSKSGITRQAELVRLMLGSAAVAATCH